MKRRCYPALWPFCVLETLSDCVPLVLQPVLSTAAVLQPYLWATSAVASYSFVLGDEHYQGMVAVWDLLNHITGAVNVRLHHDADKGVLQVCLECCQGCGVKLARSMVVVHNISCSPASFVPYWRCHTFAVTLYPLYL